MKKYKETIMDEVTPILEEIASKRSCDIFQFNADIESENIDDLILLIKSLPQRAPNIYLILTTLGGDPDAAYRLVRYIKKTYSKFILGVFGYCKSAGTLIALGADEIVISDFGELGPLDVQLSKDDELTRTSGLSYFQSLTLLNGQAFQVFEDNFLKLKRRSGNSITTKTAAEIACHIVEDTLAPIAAQIDPLRLGEVQRASQIALEYGKRICDNEDLIYMLTANYPSHDFVIDYKEAKELFKNVEEPNENEALLERHFFPIIRNVVREPIIQPLYIQEKEEQKDENGHLDLQNEPKQSSGTNPEETNGHNIQNSRATEQDIQTVAASTDEETGMRPSVKQRGNGKKADLVK